MSRLSLCSLIILWDFNGTPIATIPLSDVRVSPYYNLLYNILNVGTGNSQNDFGIIEVPGNIDLTDYGFFNVLTNYSGGTVNITGYPGAPPAFGFSHSNAITQFTNIGAVAAGSGYFIEQTAVSYPGDSGGPLWVYDGSTANAVGIVSSEFLGTGYDTQITSDDQSLITSWQDAFTTVPSGDTSTGGQIDGGKTLNVFGKTAAITVNSSGFENVYGFDIDATINDGGYQFLLQGSIASNTTVLDPGLQTIYSGATAIGARLLGGVQDVAGIASNTLICSAGTQLVENGGSAIDFTILSGGLLVISSGGYADPGTLSGGTEVISAGGSDDGTQISGGTQFVYGTATNATIFVGSQVVESGGIASGTVISGGLLIVEPGGSAIDATVYSGGTAELIGSNTAELIPLSGATIEMGAGAVTVGLGGTSSAVLAGSPSAACRPGTPSTLPTLRSRQVRRHSFPARNWSSQWE